MTKNFHYELGFLIDANIPENEHPKVIQTVKDLLLEKGANLISEIDFGRKKLNYPIKNSLKASFFVFEFTIDACEIKTIEKTLKLEKAILRFLTTKKPHNVINTKPTEIEPARGNRDNDNRDNRRERFQKQTPVAKKDVVKEMVETKEEIKKMEKIEEIKEPEIEKIEEKVIIEETSKTPDDLDKKLDEILNENKF